MWLLCLAIISCGAFYYCATHVWNQLEWDQPESESHDNRTMVRAVLTNTSVDGWNRDIITLRIESSDEDIVRLLPFLFSAESHRLFGFRVKYSLKSIWQSILGKFRDQTTTRTVFFGGERHFYEPKLLDSGGYVIVARISVYPAHNKVLAQIADFRSVSGYWKVNGSEVEQIMREWGVDVSVQTIEETND